MKQFLLINILIFALFDCRTEDTSVDPVDAQSQIQAAVDFKAKKCEPNQAQELRTRPSMPLYVVIRPLKRHLDLCTIAITRATECPFIAYPLACSFIYVKENIDYPWYINFNDVFIKQKLPQ